MFLIDALRHKLVNKTKSGHLKTELCSVNDVRGAQMETHTAALGIKASTNRSS